MIKILFNILGTLALIVGIIGLFVPLLPTTPFLLLAVACYLRGSERMYRWMLENRYFGETLARYREGGGVPRRTKIIAVSSLWVSLSVSAWLIPLWWVRAFLLACGMAVTFYLVWVVPG